MTALAPRSHAAVTAPSGRASAPGDGGLKVAAVVFTAAFLLHNADHARRGIDVVTDHVVWAGTTVAVIASVALTLIATRHRLAPFAAAVSGLAIAGGVSASHLAPRWSALSDPLPGGEVDLATWVAVLAEVVGALVLGVVGLAQVRRQGYLVERTVVGDPAA